MRDLSDLFNAYPEDPQKITIPLTKPSEDRKFTFGARSFTSLAGFKKYVTDFSHAQGLSLLSIEREDYGNVAMIYTNFDDYFPLLFIAGGDIRQQHETYLKLEPPHKLFANEYKSALEEYWEMKHIDNNHKFKAKFSVTKNHSIHVTVTGLANICHIRSIHQKGELLHDAIATAVDPSYTDFPLPQSISQPMGRREP